MTVSSTPRKHTPQGVMAKRNEKAKVQLEALADLLEAAEYREYCLRWNHIYSNTKAQDDLRAARAYSAAHGALLDIQAASRALAETIQPWATPAEAISMLNEFTMERKWVRMDADRNKAGTIIPTKDGETIKVRPPKFRSTTGPTSN